ncbi:MAG: pilus assembly protein [Hellea sp.]|nr:pilus assembly protein [Hellea sp.]
MNLRSKLKSGAARYFPTLGRLRKDRDGIAAIEFAFIAPIMIGLYFGMSELAMAIMKDRSVSHATSVSGDLATQQATLNSLDLSDVMTATLAVLDVPAAKVGLVTLELNSYEMLADGTVNQVGYARLGPTISAGGPATYDPSGLNSQMFNAQSGVVVARINYQYSPVTFKFVNDFTMAETFVMKPRKSISVLFDEGGTSSFTCSAALDLKVTCTPIV